ncbi:MAG: hypothetical protein HYY78_10020 [Betaproteobacteria bacterium]|nr:hypothetical protein [Betaproteobacteria bacterium]
MILAGNGTAIGASLFKSVAGIEAQVVPFKGTPALVTALRSDNIDVAFEFAPPALPHVKAGTMRALAVAAAKRHPDFTSAAWTSREDAARRISGAASVTRHASRSR